MISHNLINKRTKVRWSAKGALQTSLPPGGLLLKDLGREVSGTTCYRKTDLETRTKAQGFRWLQPK